MRNSKKQEDLIFISVLHHDSLLDPFYLLTRHSQGEFRTTKLPKAHEIWMNEMRCESSSFESYKLHDY